MGRLNGIGVFTPELYVHRDAAVAVEVSVLTANPEVVKTIEDYANGNIVDLTDAFEQCVDGSRIITDDMANHGSTKESHHGVTSVYRGLGVAAKHQTIPFAK